MKRIDTRRRRRRRWPTLVRLARRRRQHPAQADKAVGMAGAEGISPEEAGDTGASGQDR